MSRIAILGILSWIGAALAFGFQAISAVMGPKATFRDVCIIDFLSDEVLNWIDEMTWLTTQRAIDYIIEVPIYIMLAVIGTVLLIISGIRWR